MLFFYQRLLMEDHIYSLSEYVYIACQFKYWECDYMSDDDYEGNIHLFFNRMGFNELLRDYILKTMLNYVNFLNIIMQNSSKCDLLTYIYENNISDEDIYNNDLISYLMQVTKGINTIDNYNEILQIQENDTNAIKELTNTSYNDFLKLIDDSLSVKVYENREHLEYENTSNNVEYGNRHIIRFKYINNNDECLHKKYAEKIIQYILIFEEENKYCCNTRDECTISAVDVVIKYIHYFLKKSLYLATKYVCDIYTPKYMATFPYKILNYVICITEYELKRNIVNFCVLTNINLNLMDHTRYEFIYDVGEENEDENKNKPESYTKQELIEKWEQYMSEELCLDAELEY